MVPRTMLDWSTPFATSSGWIVHLLSSPMVVSTTNVLPFQTVSRFLEQVGLARDAMGVVVGAV